jgi:diaminopropionate ammonia-lyase
MPLDDVTSAPTGHVANPAALLRTPFPERLRAALDPEACRHARETIRRWPGHAPTPLRDLPVLAGELGIAQLLYKDEAPRFGLGSFKALGGAYAVSRVLSDVLSARLGREIPDEEVASGALADLARDITIATATDGNHGRSVAWGAQTFGARCKIYMHAAVSQGRADAVEAYGAEVVWVDGNYDESVRAAAADARANGWHIVSDTSYRGYMDVPRHVMAGYTLMTGEVIDVLDGSEPPTHVFIQGGVGGLAAAVFGHFWQHYGAARPRFVVVEPDRAPCLLESARAGRPTSVAITEETVMAGLSCGDPSLLAWDILADCADDFLAIPDTAIGPLMKRLADETAGGPIVAGESAVAGLAGLIAARRDSELSAALALDAHSRVLVIGTEGATDPEIYEKLVGRTAEEVAA